MKTLSTTPSALFRKSRASSLFEVIISLGIAGLLLATYVGYCLLIPAKLQIVTASHDLPHLVHCTNAFLETLTKEDFLNTIQGSFHKHRDTGELLLAEPLTPQTSLQTPYRYKITITQQFPDSIDLAIQFFFKDAPFFEYPYHKIFH